MTCCESKYLHNRGELTHFCLLVCMFFIVCYKAFFLNHIFHKCPSLTLQAHFLKSCKVQRKLALFLFFRFAFKEFIHSQNSQVRWQILVRCSWSTEVTLHSRETIYVFLNFLSHCSIFHDLIRSFLFPFFFMQYSVAVSFIEYGSNLSFRYTNNVQKHLPAYLQFPIQFREIIGKGLFFATCVFVWMGFVMWFTLDYMTLFILSLAM